jgi:hypothetical protein
MQVLMAVETERHLVPDSVAATMLNFDDVMGIELAAPLAGEAPLTRQLDRVRRAVVRAVRVSNSLNVPVFWPHDNDTSERQEQMEAVCLIASGRPKRRQEPTLEFVGDGSLDGTIRDGHIGTNRDDGFADPSFGFSRPPDTSTPTLVRMARASCGLMVGAGGAGGACDIRGLRFAASNCALLPTRSQARSICARVQASRSFSHRCSTASRRSTGWANLWLARSSRTILAINLAPDSFWKIRSISVLGVSAVFGRGFSLVLATIFKRLSGDRIS